MITDDIYTVSQVAEYLQVSEKTIRRLIHNQKLVASKIGSKSWRIKKTDIENYLYKNTNIERGEEHFE